MGACCVERSKVDHELDMPSPEITEKMNAFQKFELSLPFGCTWIDAFEKRVR